MPAIAAVAAATVSITAGVCITIGIKAFALLDKRDAVKG